jgi:hypothetical protein
VQISCVNCRVGVITLRRFDKPFKSYACARCLAVTHSTIETIGQDRVLLGPLAERLTA